ncbi:ABC transporter permease [Kribbella sp. NPDC056861]|uniref:ABC transporter permease n=1 Tax=Kribbella sp. NPDC056861 TaxID=3154857 RepID=UPI00343A6582
MTGHRQLLIAPALLFTGLFFVLPLLLMVVISFGSVDFVTYQTRPGWHPGNYLRALDPLYLRPILRSLAISAATVAACLMVAFPVALTMSRQRGRRQRLLLAAIIVPLWSGYVIRTYAITALIADHGPLAGLVGAEPAGLSLLYTPAAVVIGMIYAYLPLMVIPVFVALERIEKSQLLAAADLGASPWSLLYRVELPLARPGIVAGCLLVGIPAVGEYVVPAVLGGGKTLMYGNIVADQFQVTGNYPLGSALALMMTGLVTLLLLVTRRWSAR